METVVDTSGAERDRVESTLKRWEVYNYVINDDLTVDVNGHVNLSHFRIRRLTVRFGRVSGDFVCIDTGLRSLEGSPTYVGRDFLCNYNELSSLAGGPAQVGRKYYAGSNRLHDLQHLPETINSDLLIDDNPIRSFEGCPKIIEGNFDFCSLRKVNDLYGIPLH